MIEVTLCMLHELRYAFRNLRRSWLFTFITVLTLGLGIGVITALFAVVDAVLLDPIVRHQDRVVRIWQSDIERDFPRVSLAYPQFKAWRDHNRSFVGLAAIQHADASHTPMMIGADAAVVEMTPVSANFFAVLSAGNPKYGRWLEANDEAAGAELVAVASDRFFRRAAGGDPAFVGQRITYAGGGRGLRVVGVAPPEFEYPFGTDLWVPIGRLFDGRDGRFDAANRRMRHFELLGRLAPGVTYEQARAELTALDQQYAKQFPDDVRLLPIIVTPLLDAVVGNARQIVTFLFVAAALVFVIAGVNVAALLLMRASARRREIAVRVALGASRARLVKQALAEGLVLAALATAAGIAFAKGFLAVAQWVAPADVPRINDATIDLWVFAFALVAACIWVLALGAVPVWAHRQLHVAAASHDLTSRGVAGSRGLRLFTIAEIAAAVIVAIAAGLLVRSFMHLQRIDRGFASGNLVVVEQLVPQTRYPDARSRYSFYDDLVRRVEGLPGVTAATSIHLAPGSGNVGLSAALYIEGQSEEESRHNPWATWEPVMPSFFSTMGVPIVRGRAIDERDTQASAPVAVVSEAVARRYWPGQDPIGKRLQLTRSQDFPFVTVVGVAADHRYRELTKPWLTVYFPGTQFFFFQPGSLVVRTTTDPDRLLPLLRQTIRNLEPAVAIRSMATMDALLAKELSRPRTSLTVTALFALMSILLAGIGVYGVMSYEVRQRRRELAVRSALGASPQQVFRAVIRNSALLGAIGAAIGVAVAWAASQSIRSLLFELEPVDPLSFIVATIALLVIVLLASYAPARRAARVDPVASLRTE